VHSWRCSSDPDDLVEVRIDDQLVIAAPRGYEDEVRAVFAAYPDLRDEIVDFRGQLDRGEAQLIDHADVVEELRRRGVPLDEEPEAPA